MWNEPNDENAFGSGKGNHTLSNVCRMAIKEKYNRTCAIDFCSKVFHSREKHRVQLFNEYNFYYERFRSVSHHIVIPFVQLLFCQEMSSYILFLVMIRGGIESPNAEMAVSRVD
jgi:hypothetical protein